MTLQDLGRVSKKRPADKTHNLPQVSWRCASRFPLFVFLLFGIALGTMRLKAQVPAAPADAAKGKQLYLKYGCYSCHGFVGQGSTVSGPRIGPDPIPLPSFAAYLRAPAGAMPPYSEKLISDEEIARIYDFVKSLPHPPDAKKIPLLQ